jgi:2'-5' RNA ligase
VSAVRAFVALQPPDAVLDEVARVVDRIHGHAPHGRFTTRAQWHLTLRFLGQVPDDDVGAVRDALAGLEFAAGEVALGGVGAFDSPRRARVLWVGLAGGADWIAGLAGAIEDRLAGLVGPRPERDFHPHLTLARLDPPADVRGLLGPADAGTVGTPWTADEVVLFESVTAPDGARYTPLARVRLG